MKMKPKLAWFFYCDKVGKWRWRVTMPNGRIVGASTQGYVRRWDCEANAALFGR